MLIKGKASYKALNKLTKEVEKMFPFPSSLSFLKNSKTYNFTY